MLAFDPGYAALGWAAADLAPRTVRPLVLGVVSTAPEDGERRVGSAWVKEGARAQERRRVEELAVAVHLLVDRFRPAAILTEGYSPVRDSSVSGRMAMVWTTLFTESLHRGLPFHEITPIDLKVATCGRKDAGKGDVGHVLVGAYGEAALRALLAEGGARWGERDHAFDALAVARALAAEVRAALGL